MKKTFIVVLTLLAVLFSCGRLQQGAQQVNIRGMVFGTYFSITYYDEDGRVFEASIDSLFKDFNRSMSIYDRESLISRINRNETDLPDGYFRSIYSRARVVWEETQGAFDPTVSPLVNAWGFGFTDREVITEELIDSLSQLVGFEKIMLDNGRVLKTDDRVQVDFNAIAKGYAADVVGRFLESKDIDSYLVEIGGDLVVKGEKPDGSPWRIGLEIPSEDQETPQQWHYYVEIKDIGLATSGDYRRYFEEGGQRYAHTIDPKTGYPVVHSLLSVSVFAADGMQADAYATAFMVMGLDAAVEFVELRDNLEAYFIFSDDEGGFAHLATSGLNLLSREDL